MAIFAVLFSVLDHSAIVHLHGEVVGVMYEQESAHKHRKQRKTRPRMVHASERPRVRMDGRNAMLP